MIEHINAYVTIGNSDNKLTQAMWSAFCGEVNDLIQNEAFVVHGVFYSLPHTKYQNANWSFEINLLVIAFVKDKLKDLAKYYLQDSIVWTEGKPEFLRPKS